MGFIRRICWFWGSCGIFWLLSQCPFPEMGRYDPRGRMLITVKIVCHWHTAFSAPLRSALNVCHWHTAFSALLRSALNVCHWHAAFFALLRSALTACHWHAAPQSGNRRWTVGMSVWLVARRTKNGPNHLHLAAGSAHFYLVRLAAHVSDLDHLRCIAVYNDSFRSHPDDQVSHPILYHPDGTAFPNLMAVKKIQYLRRSEHPLDRTDLSGLCL